MAIPLHRARFSWGPKTHLDIEWPKGRGKEIPPLPEAPCMTLAEEEVEPDEYASRGIPTNMLAKQRPGSL